MTTLAAPPVVGERQTSTHDCGPAALASNLQWAGRTDTEPDVAQWITAQGLDQGGTAASGLAKYCEMHGLAVQWDQGNQPMSTYIPAALTRGHLVIGLHQCDGLARPVARGTTRIAHWRVFYADDIGVYRTMNSWPPDLETLYQVTFAAADLRSHVEVMLPVAQGDPMTPEEHAWLLAVYDAIYGPAPPQAWNNIEILRRQAVLNGAPYSPAQGVPPTPPPAVQAGGLTAAQASALAEIPALVTAVNAIAAKVGKDLA